MPGVYWSSKVEPIGFWWRWSAVVYDAPAGDYDKEVKNRGWALTRKRAQQKLNRWLIEMGQIVG